MARYPTLPFNITINRPEDGYQKVQTWSEALLNELDTRDTQVDATPSTNIFAVTTITVIGRPKKGDIAYSTSSGKFRGYVSLGSETSWQDLN
jgi:hypothetical protein|tara:strand:+ start:3448 stop:3723 length:276 start_codon:yes stop_codon:yes gene_type:complete